MTYAIAKIYFLGSDDVNYQGLMLKEVESAKLWQEAVQKVVEQEFEENRYMTIYHSDNCGTIFNTVEQVMKTLSFVEIEKKTYEEISSIVGKNFGHMPWFVQ